MKISSIHSIVGQYNMQRTEAVQARPKAYSQADKVELSANAQLFTEAFATVKQQMQQEPLEYSLKVGDVLSRMRSGVYAVDSGDLCDKLLA